jgi:hypothetical protein
MPSNLRLRHELPDLHAKCGGFYSSREAAEDGIRTLRFQPSFFHAPDGFSIEEVELDRSLRFLNATGKPLELTVEPWASTVEIAAGAHFIVHYPTPGDREDTSLAEWGDGTVTIWCSGSTYELDVDGERILT